MGEKKRVMAVPIDGTVSRHGDVYYLVCRKADETDRLVDVVIGDTGDLRELIDNLLSPWERHRPSEGPSVRQLDLAGLVDELTEAGVVVSHDGHPVDVLDRGELEFEVRLLRARRGPR